MDALMMAKITDTLLWGMATAEGKELPKAMTKPSTRALIRTTLIPVGRYPERLPEKMSAAKEMLMTTESTPKITPALRLGRRRPG
jgi:hypothetical protein